MQSFKKILISILLLASNKTFASSECSIIFGTKTESSFENHILTNQVRSLGIQDLSALKSLSMPIWKNLYPSEGIQEPVGQLIKNPMELIWRLEDQEHDSFWDGNFVLIKYKGRLQMFLGRGHVYLSGERDVFAAGNVYLAENYELVFDNVSGHYLPNSRQEMNIKIWFNMFKSPNTNTQLMFKDFFKAEQSREAAGSVRFLNMDWSQASF